MEQKPIERVVVWNTEAQGWYDKETDVWIQNLTPRDFKAPSQPDDWPPFTTEQWDLIKARIDKVLADRVIPAFPAYFVNEQWLVTYQWAKYLADRTEERAIEQVWNRLPRWVRWLSR